MTGTFQPSRKQPSGKLICPWIHELWDSSLSRTVSLNPMKKTKQKLYVEIRSPSFMQVDGI
eukprot:2413247-Karenia_brevis.AAC.1